MVGRDVSKEYEEIKDKIYQEYREAYDLEMIGTFETYCPLEYQKMLERENISEEQKEIIKKFNLNKVKWIIPGGESALASQFNGLDVIRKSSKSNEKDIVLIHDGVRPLINEKIISDCIAGVKKYGSAVTVAPAIETIIKTDEQNIITETFLRSDCQLARAPQSFFLRDIVCAHEQAKSKGIYDFVDSTSLMLHFGYKIHTIEGPSENIKVTNPADFYICRALLDAKENSQIYGI